MKYDPKNSNWRILGMSKAFKLDLMEDDNNSPMKQSSSFIDNSKNNTSFIDFFNKSILGFNDSPPKHDLRISKLQQIQIDEDKEPDFNKKKTNLNNIFPNEDKDKDTELEESFKCSTNQTTRSIPASSKVIFEKPMEKKEPNKNLTNKNNSKEEKLIEINDAQKFYAESLMRIKKSNQDFVLSPKNKFPGIGKMKKKGDSNSKENVFKDK